MAQRRHGPDVNWWLVFVPLVVVGAGVALFLALRGKDEGPSKPKPSPAPPFVFTVEDITGVPVGAKRADRDVLEEAKTAISGVMSVMYDGAFVTRAQWGDGTFPKALEQFAPDSACEAGKDLAELTLGPESARLSSVKPGANGLSISVLLDKDKPTGAVAKVAFQAVGVLKEGGKLAITHGGTYFLEPVDGTWKIVGWQIDGSLDKGAAVPAPTPSETSS